MLFKQHKLESFDSDLFDPDLFDPDFFDALIRSKSLKKLTLRYPVHTHLLLFSIKFLYCPSLEFLSFTNLFEDTNFLFLTVLRSSSLTTLTLNINEDAFEMARKVLMEYKAQNMPKLKVVRSLSGLTILEL